MEANELEAILTKVVTGIDELNQRIRRLELVQLGKCPYCGRTIAGWQTPFGDGAPEIWAILRGFNVDPITGHMENCLRKDVRIAQAT